MTIHKTNIEVRYQETDQMGVVYHANYLVWFEIGRTKLIEQLGFKYMDMEKDNIISPVMNVQVSYKKPAKYGDDITIHTWVKFYNGIRTIYGYTIKRHEDLLVTGYTEHIVVDKEKFRPLRIYKLYPKWHQAFLKEVEGDDT